MREAPGLPVVNPEMIARMITGYLEVLEPIAAGVHVATGVLSSCALSLKPVLKNYEKLNTEERDFVRRSITIVTNVNTLWELGMKSVYKIDDKLKDLHLALINIQLDLLKAEDKRRRHGALANLFNTRPKPDINVVNAIEEPMYTLMQEETFRQNIRMTADLTELYERHRSQTLEQTVLPPAYLNVEQKQSRLEELAQENDDQERKKADQERRDRELAEELARGEAERVAQENLKKEQELLERIKEIKRLEKEQEEEKKKETQRFKEAQQKVEEASKRRRKAEEEHAKRVREWKEEEERKRREIEVESLKLELAEAKKRNDKLVAEQKERSRRHSAEPPSAPQRTNVHVSASINVEQTRGPRRSTPRRRRSRSVDGFEWEDEYPEQRYSRNPFLNPGARIRQAVRNQYMDDHLQVTQRAFQHLDLDHGHRGYGNSQATSMVVSNSFNNNSVQIGRARRKVVYDSYEYHD